MSRNASPQFLRAPQLAQGPPSSLRPPVPARQASSGDSAPSPKAAPLFRSNSQRARDSARSPAAFAADYNGRQFPQSAHHGPSRGRSRPRDSCFSFWPRFEPSVFLAIFPPFDVRLSIVDCRLRETFAPPPSSLDLRRPVQSIFRSAREPLHVPGRTGTCSLLSPCPSRLWLIDFIIFRIWKYCFKT